MTEEKIIKVEGRFGIGIKDTGESFIEFIGNCLQTQEPKIIFDSSNVSFIYPIGIITLAGLGMYLAKYRQKNIQIKLPKDVEVKNYLIETKFMELAGIKDIKLEESIAHNGSLMLPLKQLFRTDGYSCDKLLSLINKGVEMSPSVRSNLFESIMEMQANVMEHSETKDGYFMIGQSYPETKRVRVSILDLGIGIKTHLMRSGLKFEQNNDSFIIVKAFEEGISGTGDTGRGIGLSVLKEFIDKCEGSLVVISNKGFFIRAGKKIVIQRDLSFDFPGTLIDITVNAQPGRKFFMKGEEIPPQYKLLED